ncbi:manganese-dependent ADP-ribose/CDP-alcohol diphosphatase-like [Spea bombifrons]|uniref:manganese-dependent ADP-ribose/CDP-alcohol diphosphatase-like n=1 Tax=Spea bombifrons TaxID=233779 RepID=UPI00234AEC79|nr:manganese-dependent ADP-ribose/CDP-alcohol diphosphatase-like [Spea bombifrons]
MGACAQKQQPCFTFGVIADVQFADRPDSFSRWNAMRYYRQSCLHLRNAIDEWNKEDIPASFVFQLGDIIDGSNRRLRKSQQALEIILKEFERLKAPVHHVLGNHELDNFDRQYLWESALNTIWMSDKTHDGPSMRGVENTDCASYYAYSFSPYPNFRCVVVDSYDLSFYRQDESNPKYQETTAFLERNQNAEPGDAKKRVKLPLMEFNGGFSRSQLSWLDEVLTFSDKRKERVIVAGHNPIHPRAALVTCLAWNALEMLDLLHSHPSVVCYIAGHDHNGGYHEDSRGIHHVTMEGVIESPAGTNAFATACAYDDRLILQGRGRVQSRVLRYRK